VTYHTILARTWGLPFFSLKGSLRNSKTIKVAPMQTYSDVSLRGGVLPPKQSPSCSGDCFAARTVAHTCTCGSGAGNDTQIDFLIFATEQLKSSLREIAPPQAGAIREDPASACFEQLAALEP
jgi:hypothetical protein